jgi:hypothetical protein
LSKRIAQKGESLVADRGCDIGARFDLLNSRLRALDRASGAIVRGLPCFFLVLSRGGRLGGWCGLLWLGRSLTICGWLRLRGGWRLRGWCCGLRLTIGCRLLLWLSGCLCGWGLRWCLRLCRRLCRRRRHRFGSRRSRFLRRGGLRHELGLGEGRRGQGGKHERHGAASKAQPRVIHEGSHSAEFLMAIDRAASVLGARVYVARSFVFQAFMRQGLQHKGQKAPLRQGAHK